MRGDEFFLRSSKQPLFAKLHPRVAAFLQGYFAKEKVIPFGDRFVVNTNFPPYPSAAFDRMVGQFAQSDVAAARRLFSVTLAVTNRCPLTAGTATMRVAARPTCRSPCGKTWRANCRTWAR